MSDGFLSRWSRRKRGDEPMEPAPDAAPDPVSPEAAEAGPVEAGGADSALSPEELAALPSLDELTAETDVTAFLRKGVPRALRNAALRRAWVLDPQVRDFVCEAREYAYDWNVPGGVPGNGDLLPTDDVAGMLRGIFGEGPPEQVADAAGPPDAFADSSADGDCLRDPVSHSDDDALQGQVDVGGGAPGTHDPAMQNEPADPGVLSACGTLAFEGEPVEITPAATGDGLAATQPEHATAELPVPSQRRHGRAVPI